VEGSGLLSSTGARGSPVADACCAVSGMVASTVGAGLRLLSVAPPTVSQFSSSPVPRGRMEEYPATTQESTIGMQYSTIST
jgi:hypothetical protein